MHACRLEWWWISTHMVTKSTRQHLTAPITILSTPHQWWMLHQQSVINENTQINFKGSTCQKSILMKRHTSNAWVMVGLMIMIAMMNHVETPNKQSDFLTPSGGKKRQTQSFEASVYEVWVCGPTHLIYSSTSCHCQFQIWFYTNDIFKNAGIPEPHIQYTTVGTGAIEVISGMLGVSRCHHT